MANAALIGYGQIGDAAQPSPSIWADCPNSLLNDLGLGYFFVQDFLGDYATPAATTTPPGIELNAGAGTNVFGTAASATFGANVLSAATGATDNNNFTLYGEELGTIVRNSGKRLWFEARVAPTLLGDTAFALGFTTLANAQVAAGPIAVNPSNSAVATLTAATSILFATAQAASAIATVNAIYAKGTATPVTVLADVTNATAITAAGGTASSLAAAKFRKFGIRFDGLKHLYFYVDGYKVASQEVDSTVDQTAIYCPFIQARNGASTALTLNIDFIRAAYQART